MMLSLLMMYELVELLSGYAGEGGLFFLVFLRRFLNAAICDSGNKNTSSGSGVRTAYR